MKEKRTFILMEYLIEQCKNPTGFVGKRMIDIWNQSFRKMAIWGISHVVIDPSDTLLEIGFGGGFALSLLSRKIDSGKLYGVDISEVAVQKATKKNQSAIRCGKLKIMQSSVEKMVFPAATFQQIFAIQTHFYWQELEQSLIKIAVLLTETGSLNIICEKNKLTYHLPKYVEQNKMIELLHQAGFKQVKLFETSKWIHYQGIK